ncbi:MULTISPECIES: adenosylcobinamide-GDP ribazoletransferase [Cyanophyceae]|uniref:adenosylcobinamide-GDP ribazoletransferase n=1 Tax=Cyanophyceae TaxID=3028117 RepID=UPI00232F121D|nr:MULTISPECIES: adenosylcobinamide-GDP ribazoletransferase [Cyanophyceae]MDB9357120.1 adenosylcobinamide-GDP ribazoletransferase [Nodularia spumigena CS-587/03]MDB9304532.1 adenosylcobinamide-GDP ribazoletransferase [Nodularia spumigena CS-591/12]MDB9322547.1 adenosylcobinamide-GDP ribazoletransferase [Nodularia spumigena CS-591/07A]MDB9339148.1 adenosylcobinamide-GDP ribazoletransferase [Nodularia spumigena CS-589/07]MDB9359314.1 adenosylcobinamide-GDP ribazoletransferase [Nodularia spumigen
MNQPQWWKKLVFDLFASVIFYSSIPLPYINGLDFRRVAYFAPLVGLMIGGILGLCDLSMNYLGIPVLTRSALVVSLWMAITGGLHLDGVMDTADGLAVGNPEKRLEVMTDSATGAFGAMAAIALILLKTTALIDIGDHRWLVLMAACGWGRWGQQLAIACYPYLKPTGKGAFHKAAIRSSKDLLPGLLLLFILSGLLILLDSQNLWFALSMILSGSAIATLTGLWFYHKLGGHTGDTYGAVVEWTEALFLCVLTIF